MQRRDTTGRDARASRRTREQADRRSDEEVEQARLKALKRCMGGEGEGERNDPSRAVRKEGGAMADVVRR